MSDHKLGYYQHPISRPGVVPQFRLGYNCTCAVAHGLLEVQCCHGNEHAWRQVSRFCLVPAVNFAIFSSQLIVSAVLPDQSSNTLLQGMTHPRNFPMKSSSARPPLEQIIRGVTERLRQPPATTENPTDGSSGAGK